MRKGLGRFCYNCGHYDYCHREYSKPNDAISDCGLYYPCDNFKPINKVNGKHITYKTHGHCMGLIVQMPRIISRKRGGQRLELVHLT